MLKKLLIFLCPLLFSFTLSPLINASSLPSIEDVTRVDGGSISSSSSYEIIKATTISSSGEKAPQVVSYVKANKNAKLVNYASTSKDGIKGKTVMDLTKEYASKNPHVKVLAAVNADYFYTSNGSFIPINAYVENGNIINGANHSKYYSLAYNNSIDYEVIKKLDLTDNYYLTIYNQDGLIEKEIILDGKNILPSSESTTFYYKNSSHISNDKVSFFEISNPDACLNVSNIYISGKIEKKISETSTSPVVATTSKEIINLLEKNPYVRIQPYLKDIANKYENLIGIGSVPLLDGLIRNNSEIGDQNVSFCEARHPRTSLGFSSDGTYYLAAIDGRSTTSAGVSLREEAAIMKSLGCTTCFNFDGGGSTQLVINDNGNFRYLNNPTERYRKVVDIVLLVEEDFDIQIESSVDKENSSISFNYEINSLIANYDAKVYFDGEETNNKIINNVSFDSSHYLSIKITYQKNGKQEVFVKNKLLYVVTSKIKPNLRMSSDFKLEYEKSKNGIKVKVKCQDLDNLITKLYVIYQDKEYIAIKENDCYLAEIDLNNEGVLNFNVSYYYKEDGITIKNKIIDDNFTYDYKILYPSDVVFSFSNNKKGTTLTISLKDNGIKVNKYILNVNGNNLTSSSNIFNLSISNGDIINLTIEYYDEKILRSASYTYTYTASKIGCKKNSNTKKLMVSLIGLTLILPLIYRKKQ